MIVVILVEIAMILVMMVKHGECGPDDVYYGDNMMVLVVLVTVG
jgi:hypothetical protein